MRREDDKVTRWIRQNWSIPYAGHEHMWLAMAMARFINWPETLENLGFPDPWDPSYYTAALEGMVKRGEKVWTGAYTVSTNGRAMAKHDYIVGHVLTAVARAQPVLRRVTTCGGAWQALTAIDGVGSFMAGQIIADMKNTPKEPLSEAPDRRTFACPGPGSVRGLNRYFCNRLDATMSKEIFLHLLNRVQEETSPLISLDLDAQDWQNVMCEFDKYRRIQEGGRVRARYVPA